MGSSRPRPARGQHPRREGPPECRAVTLLALVTVSGLVLSACGGGQADRAGVASSATPSASATVVPPERVQAELAVDGEPDWLAVAGGSLWVARSEAGAVDRIDPATDQVRATVPVGGQPCNGAAAGFGAVWVPSCEEHAVYRVDAQTGEVEAVVEVPVYQSVTGVPPSGGLAAGLGAVWIVTEGRTGAFDTLAQIDPRTNSVVRRIGLGHVGGRVAVDASSVWVTSPTEGMLLRVDPRSGDVTEIDGLVQPTAVTTGLGATWVLSGRWTGRPHGDGSVTRVDPRTDEVVARIRIEEASGTPGSLTTGGGFLWARTSATSLAKIDPGSDVVVEAYRNDKGNGDLAFGFDSLWQSDFVFDTVRRLSPGPPSAGR